LQRLYNKSENLPRIRTGSYSHKQYSKLTDEEKEEVKKLRQEKRNTNVSSTNTKSTTKRAETKSTASVSAIITTPTIVDKPEQITTMACSIKTNQAKITENGTGTTSPTLTLGKSTVNFKNNANFKPYWLSKLYKRNCDGHRMISLISSRRRLTAWQIFTLLLLLSVL
jgi:hypothetical protein